MHFVLTQPVCGAIVPELPVSGIQSHTVTIASFSPRTNPDFLWVGTLLFFGKAKNSDLLFLCTPPPPSFLCFRVDLLGLVSSEFPSLV